MRRNRTTCEKGLITQKVKFYIGDVRSLDSVEQVVQGVDYIFHAAALKQVPSCEFFPIEAVRTNILGTDNVLSAAARTKSKMWSSSAPTKGLPYQCHGDVQSTDGKSHGC